MKVVISNPPWETDSGYGCRSNTRWPHTRKDKYLIFPIYLAYTAAILEKSGVETVLVDAVAEEYDSAGFISRIKKENADICFIETSTPTIEQDLKNALAVKKILNVKVFLFGTHATVYHRQILESNPGIDGIIRGEFEFTIKDISLGKELKNIDGLTYSDKNSVIQINQDRPFVVDLDEFPFPAWHCFDMKKYESHLYRSPSAMMITSRGCPFQCTYCLWPDVMYGHRQRFRSAENVCDEMETLIEKYGVKEIRFDDDTFALNPKHVLAICDEIEKRGINKKIQWTCFGHIAQDDEKLYRRLRRAGCFKIDFGVESGSPKILKYMKKSLNPAKARRVVKMCKAAGLQVYCDFMMGFPHETKEDIEMSIDLARSLDCDFIQVSFVVPYPGTRMFADGVRENFLIDPYNWESYAACAPKINTGEISPESLDKLYRLFWRKFYLRPGVIFRRLRKAIVSKDEFVRTWKGFISFLKRISA